MKKLYVLTMLAAASLSIKAQASDQVNISAGLFEKEGFTVGGDYYPGDDRIMPIEWVEYEGYRISFKIYPQDWEDPEGELSIAPRDPMYMLPDGPYEPQWRVFANNEFTVSAPEGYGLTSIEISLVSNCYNYGDVTSDVGNMSCNGGKADSDHADRVAAEPYVWTSDNDKGYPSVTFTLAANAYDGKSTQQFYFNSVAINSHLTTSVPRIENDGSVTVYGIDGTLLLRNAPAEATGSLGKGCYIINGKKIIIL